MHGNKDIGKPVNTPQGGKYGVGSIIITVAVVHY